MTQEVQPLTWQKRTNIEEHQQFFSKINEIIDNLAPTVDEAEAAIAQATAAIASANDAIATANAASAAASAAASQAQTAASTVAGYDTRLTAAEDSIDTQGQQITVLQGRTGALETGMTALGTRMTAAETKNSQQDTAIAALQTADGQNVKINNINQYAVGLTGNQPNITGVKTFLQAVRIKNNNDARETVPATQVQTQPSQVIGSDDQQIFFEQVITDVTGNRWFTINLYGTNGQRVQLRLIHIDANGNVTLPWS